MRYLLFVLVFFIACSTHRQAVLSDQGVPADGRDEIRFYYLKIGHDPGTNHNRVNLIRQSVSVGKLKEQNLPVHSDTYLTISVDNGAGQSDSFQIEHPLYRRVEYVQDSVLMNKEMTLDESEFFIRVPVKRGITRAIRITETLNDSVRNNLLTIKI
jgi:hypothetical protein